MKKTLIVFGLILATSLSLTNCTKEIEGNQEENNTPEVVNEGIPFELFAKTVDTKTTNDGMDTKWTADDGISVFHAAAGATTNYVKDGEFTIAEKDLASGTFKGTLSSVPTEGTHDWFVFYPYNQGLDSPANTNDYYFTVGQTMTGNQTQKGNDSMAHLAGPSFPLYGKAAGVAYNETPSITMNHALAYIEFIITNDSTEPLTVEQITFKGTEDIVGSYYIDFHDSDNVVFTPKDNSVNEVATLNVTDGDEISVGGSASFFIGIKPFTAPKDEDIEVTINGYKKTFTITNASGTKFQAGMVKKVRISYDYEYLYFVHSTSIAKDDVVILTSGLSGNVSVMKHYDSNALSGNAYGYTTLSVNGGIITSTSDVAILTVGDGGNSMFTFYDSAISAYVDATSQTSSNYMKTAVTTGDNSKFTVSFADSGDDEGAANITNTAKASRNVIRYNGRFACYNSGTQSPVYMFKKVNRPVSIEITTNPTKTSYKCGETIDLAGMVVIATYSDSSTEDVAASVTTNAAEVLAHVGSAQTVTVSYMGLTDTFTIDVAKGDAGLSYATTAYTVAPSASFTAPTLSNPHGLSVTYSASNSKATVNASTGAVTISSETGTVTITAHTDGNDDYNAGDASYTITIKSIRTYTYTFSSKAWASDEAVSSGSAPGYSWSGDNDGNQKNSQGVQILGDNTSVVTCSNSFTNVSQIVVTYSTNASKGAGSIKVKVGTGSEKTFTVTKPSSGGTTDKTATFNFSPNETGVVVLTAAATANSVYIKSIAITAE